MGENITTFYSGAPPLNRLSFHRHSSALLNNHLSNPLARFLAFSSAQDGSKPLCLKSAPNHPVFLGWDDVKAFFGPEGEVERESFFVKDTKDGGETGKGGQEETIKHLQGGRLPSESPIASLVFLGTDERLSERQTLMTKKSDHHQQQQQQQQRSSSPSASPSSADEAHPERSSSNPPIFAVTLPPSSTIPPELRESLLKGGERDFVDSRAAAASGWGDWEAGVFAGARSMVDWNGRNKFCAGCGSTVYSLWGGWKLSCSSALGSEPSTCPSFKGLNNYCYPRTDMVLIMGIISEDGDRILLGRQRSWPKGMYSCLAGFAEPGESVEDAVRREVYEESGIVVGSVFYHSSQPWPYPANLMIGCFGRADASQPVRLDLDNELEDARWFTRQQILDILSDPDGTVIRRDEQGYFEPGAAPNAERAVEKFRLPPKTAIAGVLASAWAKGEVVGFGFDAAGESSKGVPSEEKEEVGRIVREDGKAEKARI